MATDRAPNEAAVLALCRLHRLTVSGASSLELARREGLMLATLDADLIRATGAEHQPLLGDAA